MMYSTFYRRVGLLIAGLSYLQTSQSAPVISPQFVGQIPGMSVTSTDGATTLTADDARPFGSVADVIRIQYGAVICYEDPPYTHPDDLKNRLVKGTRRWVIPAGGRLSLTYSADDIETVLKQLVQTHLNPDRGAHFRVMRVGSVYMIVPTDVRDLTGVRSTSQSPLDVRITMSAKTLGPYKLLTTLLDLVADASKQQIVYINGPGPDIPGSPTYDMSAQDEPARNVLLRALALMEPQLGPMAWDLLYDPDSGKYFMSFNGVTTNPAPQPTTAPSNAPVNGGANTAVAPISPR